MTRHKWESYKWELMNDGSINIHMQTCHGLEENLWNVSRDIILISFMGDLGLNNLRWESPDMTKAKWRSARGRVSSGLDNLEIRIFATMNLHNIDGNWAGQVVGLFIRTRLEGFQVEDRYNVAYF